MLVFGSISNKQVSLESLVILGDGFFQKGGPERFRPILFGSFSHPESPQSSALKDIPKQRIDAQSILVVFLFK